MSLSLLVLLGESCAKDVMRKDLSLAIVIIRFDSMNSILSIKNKLVTMLERSVGKKEISEALIDKSSIERILQKTVYISYLKDD